jgi:hypothetical protein
MGPKENASAESASQSGGGFNPKRTAHQNQRRACEATPDIPPERCECDGALVAPRQIAPQYRADSDSPKGAISSLPEETAITSVKRLDSFRGYLLYLFDELSLGNSSRQRRNNVNVIGNTADAHEFGTEVAADCCKISMRSWPDL